MCARRHSYIQLRAVEKERCPKIYHPLEAMSLFNIRFVEFCSKSSGHWILRAAGGAWGLMVKDMARYDLFVVKGFGRQERRD